MKMRSLILILLLALVSCTQSVEEQVAKKQADITRLRFELRQMDAEALKSRISKQIDSTLLDPETRQAMIAADRDAESAERMANAEIRRDINAAIVRLEREIAELRNQR